MDDDGFKKISLSVTIFLFSERSARQPHITWEHSPHGLEHRKSLLDKANEETIGRSTTSKENSHQPALPPSVGSKPDPLVEAALPVNFRPWAELFYAPTLME
jgi:hypothetical protein